MRIAGDHGVPLPHRRSQSDVRELKPVWLLPHLLDVWLVMRVRSEAGGDRGAPSSLLPSNSDARQRCRSWLCSAWRLHRRRRTHDSSCKPASGGVQRCRDAQKLTAVSQTNQIACSVRALGLERCARRMSLQVASFCCMQVRPRLVQYSHHSHVV